MADLNELQKRLKAFFDQGAKTVGQAAQNAGAQIHSGFWRSPVGQGLVQTQKVIESPQSIGLPQVPNNMNPSFGGPLQIKPIQIARDVINEPIAWTANTVLDAAQNIGRTIGGRQLASYGNLKSPVTKLGYNIGSQINPEAGKQYGVNNNLVEVLANAGGSAMGPLSVYGGGKLANVGKNAVIQAPKHTLKYVVTKGAMEGARAGAAYGAAQGLSSGRDKDLMGQLVNTGINTLSGLALGGAMGAASSAGGYTVGAAKDSLAKLLTKKYGMNQQQAEVTIKKFARDEFGRFIGRKMPDDPNVPPGLHNNLYNPKYAVMYGDMRETIRLPRDGNYQSGHFDPEEFIPKKKKMSEAQLQGIVYKDVPVSQIPEGGGVPPSGGEFQNPENPFYNVKRIGVDDAGKENIKAQFEVHKDQVLKTMGDKLTHKEVEKKAMETTATLNKTIGREETLKVGAAYQNLRDSIARMEKEGKVTPEYLNAILEDKAAGTHLARLLGQRGMVSDGERTPMREILEEVMKKNQKHDEILAAAKTVDFNDANQAADFYRKFVKPSLSDYLDLVRYNSMLSSPNTHINNAFSNLGNSAIVAPGEKTLTGVVDYLNPVRIAEGKKQQHFAGEGAAYVKGYWSSVGKASHRFADVLRGKIQADNFDYKRVSPLHGKKGEVFFSLPTRMLEASDHFFTTLVEGGEKGALKYKQSKGVNVGDIEQEAARKAAYRLYRSDLFDKEQGHVLNSIDHITDILQRARSLRAADDAPSGIKGGAKIASTIAKFTLPFVRTPMNIAKQMIEYSPAGFATLPGAGNKTEQFTKAIMGTAGMAAAMMMVSSGRTTWQEPTDTKKRNAFRDAGLQPYSVKIGDQWISYAKLPPPLAVPLMITSALHEAYENKTIDQTQLDAILTGLASTGHFYSDQTYLKSIGDAISATQGSPEDAARFISNYPQQLVPYRALMGWMARLADPYQRKVDTDAPILTQQLQQLLTQIPVASGMVPARVNEYGEPIPNQNKEINAISPLKITTERPAEKETYDLMEKNSMLNKNVNAAEKMIERGENPDFGFLGQAEASESDTANYKDKKQQEIFEKMAKKEVELKGGIKTVGDKTFYTNEDGGVSSFDAAKVKEIAAMDTGNEYQQAIKDSEAYKLSQKILELPDDEFTKESKSKLIEQMGLSSDDVEYYQVANDNNNLKTLYVMDKIKGITDRDSLFNTLTELRKSVNDKEILADGVIDNLVDDGTITKAEGKVLKSLKYDKKGIALKSSGSGKGRGVRDVARMKISAPTVKFTAMKRRALPTVRLKGAANKTISIQKVGPSKSVKIIAPKASHSYKIVRPKLTGLQTGIKIV